jgi:hypothetical protein
MNWKYVCIFLQGLSEKELKTDYFQLLFEIGIFRHFAEVFDIEK